LPFATTGSVASYSIALGRLVLDCASRREICLLADDDAVQRRCRLQPRRRVHDVARNHRRLAERRACTERDDGLTGVDGDPDLQPAVSQLAGAVADDQCGPHGALRVVPVRERRPEDAHHGVADELLDDAAERLDLAAHPIVLRREHRADVLRVETLRADREADEVDKDHRDDATLLAWDGLRAQRCTAGEAETRLGRVLLAAGRAADGLAGRAQAAIRFHEADSSGDDASVCQTTQ